MNATATLWWLQDMRTNRTIDHVFSAEHLAMHVAERMVGNRSVADCGEILLYGPGDGNTTVMIRRISRDDALKMDLDISFL